MASMYDDFMTAGLINPKAEREAALMGLFALGNQIGNRSAPRLSPTPPPMDLNAVMQVYQNQMNLALKRGLMKKKLREERNMREMFMPQPVNEAEAQRIAQRNYRPMEQAQTALYGVSPLSGEDNDMSLEAGGIPAMAQDAVTAALPAARRQTTVPAVLQSVPAAMHPFYKGMANSGLGKEAIASIGSLIAQSVKPSTYSVSKTGPNSYGVVDSRTGTVTPIKNVGAGSTFSGTGFTAQSANVVMSLSDKIIAGTATPRERQAYALAHGYLSRSRIEQRPQAGGETLSVQVPGQDLSMFPPPNSTQTATASAPAPAAPSTNEKVVGTKRPTPPSEGQVSAAMFAVRMNAAAQVMSDIEAQHGSAAFLSQGQEMLESLPGVGAFAQRKSMTEIQQRYRAAAMNWMMATLRDESGAAISIAEAERQYDTYFPRPGDSAGVIEDKNEMREILTKEMNERARPAQDYQKTIKKIMPTLPQTPNAPPETADELRRRYGLPAKKVN